MDYLLLGLSYLGSIWELQVFVSPSYPQKFIYTLKFKFINKEV